jgi:diguanylate cyclase (GGDEF)-like protein
MNELFLRQIVDTINTGLVVLDPEFRVGYWNRWMALHSGRSTESVLGVSLLELYPQLDTPRFVGTCKTVLAFGHYSFLSQRLHKYLFPFPTPAAPESAPGLMMQSCSIFPLRDAASRIVGICIAVQDVTEMVAYEQKLLAMSRTDALTGVFNRRHLEDRLREEFARRTRYHRPLGIILFDLDNFKLVNDTYGHQCGDFILQSVAATVRATMREVDVLARYGGEEFCCLLPETPLPAARQLAERIRCDVMRQRHRYGEKEVAVTVSIGVAVLDESVGSIDALLKIVDDALYDAKRNGRNQVCAPAPDPGGEPG